MLDLQILNKPFCSLDMSIETEGLSEEEIEKVKSTNFTPKGLVELESTLNEPLYVIITYPYMQGKMQVFTSEGTLPWYGDASCGGFSPSGKYKDFSYGKQMEILKSLDKNGVCIVIRYSFSIKDLMDSWEILRKN